MKKTRRQRLGPLLHVCAEGIRHLGLTLVIFCVGIVVMNPDDRGVFIAYMFGMLTLFISGAIIKTKEEWLPNLRRKHTSYDLFDDEDT